MTWLFAPHALVRRAAIMLAICALASIVAFSVHAESTWKPLEGSWIERVDRPVGLIRGPKTEKCPAVIISPDYILEPECETPIPAGGARRFYMPGGTKENGYNLRGAPAASGPGWRLHQVAGRPSRHYGIVKLAGEKPSPQHVLKVIRVSTTDDSSRSIALCRMINTPAADRHFSYSCEDPDHSLSSGAEFIFSLTGELLGLKLRNDQKVSNDIVRGLPISEIARLSKIIKPLTQPRGLYVDVLAGPNELSCTRAAQYAEEQESILALFHGDYDRVAVFLKACSEQLAINKERTPDERILVIVRKNAPLEGSTYSLEHVERSDRARIVFACMTHSTGRVEILQADRIIGANGADLDWSKRLGCAAVHDGFLSNVPFMIRRDHTALEVKGMQDLLKERGLHSYASAIQTLWQASSVLDCYKAGNTTVADMYACAGVWVTPRILTLCFLEAGCPVIHDSIEARSVVEAALGGPGKLDTKLSVDMLNVLSAPDRKVIEECKSGGPSAATECVAKKMASASLKPLMDCGAIKDNMDKARCLTKGTPKVLTSVVECLSAKGADPAAYKECTADPKVEVVKNCVSVATGNAKIDCLLANADPTQRAFAYCLSASSNRMELALDCLRESNPQIAEKIAVASCAAKAVDAKAAASCFTRVMDGDAGKIGECAKGPKEKMVSCFFGDKPEYKAASQVVACVQGGRDASSLLANCSDFLVKDPKTRAVLACVAQAGSDNNKLAGCAASSVLPPEIARLAGCAAASQGPTSFALCAAGPLMNEEWRIAAECAVHSGGEPISFAGCTAGRLTVKELTQCFSGGSCFGPNNTIVKYYTNAFNDVLHGPGASNEIVVALGKLGEATGGPNSVVNKPSQVFGGENSLFRNPGQVVKDAGKAIDGILNYCKHNWCP